MKKSKRNISLTLLCVFAGLSLMPFFSPAAPPSPQDDEVRLIKFEDANGHDVAGLLRSVTESQEENSKPTDLVFDSFIEDFHSVCGSILLAEARNKTNARRATEYIYLLHSSLTI